MQKPGNHSFDCSNRLAQAGQINFEGTRLNPSVHVSVVRYAPQLVLEPHAHEGGSFSIVLGGSLRERVGNEDVSGVTGAVLLKPEGILHGNSIGPSGATLLAIRGRAVDRLASRGWAWRSCEGAAFLGLQTARHIVTGARLAAEESVLALFDLASGSSLEDGAVPPAWLSRVRDQLEDEVKPPTVRALAGEAGVHPVYLTRVFRRHYGCSISRYIRRARVRRAADLLVLRELNVSQVAASLDFFDQSHLCRAFNAELGLSPTEYRRIVLG